MVHVYEHNPFIYGDPTLDHINPQTTVPHFS